MTMGRKRSASSSEPTPTETPHKAKKKKKILSHASKLVKKESDKRRSKTRINIGDAFPQWRLFRHEAGVKRDSDMALLLLKRYKETGAAEHPSSKSHQPRKHSSSSSSVTSGDSDRDHVVVAGEKQEIDLSIKSIELHEVEPDDPSQSVIEFEDDLDADPFDSDYVPPVSLYASGPSQKSVEDLPVLGLEDSVFDISEREEDPEDDSAETDPEDEEKSANVSDFPKTLRVLDESDLINQPACIAYSKNLLLMANFLQLPISKCSYSEGSGAECDGRPPFTVKLRYRGTAVILEWFCPHGHRLWRWNSQPLLEQGTQAGDFMLSVNVLLSGNNYTKIALLLKFMNMRMTSSATLDGIHRLDCEPVIKQFWTEKRADVIHRLRTKDGVVVLADGQMDLPGHSAMCCTYTTMDKDSLDVINVVTVEKRDVEGKIAAMEKDAFIKTFDILTLELNIKEIVTNSHEQIASLMHPQKGRYKEKGVCHSLDVWHAAKNLTKKLHAAGMMRGQKQILSWIKDIVNHFWICCQHANSREEFMSVWRSVLHHVCGKHVWILGRCLHVPSDEEPRDRDVISPGSAAHVALSHIVFNRKWLQDVEKYITFRTTSQLESFQNHLLTYAGQGLGFSSENYEARTFLAALDYNHHNHRPVYINKQGHVSFQRLYSKKSQRYRVTFVKEAKDYSYIPELQNKILKKHLYNVKLPTKST